MIKAIDSLNFFPWNSGKYSIDHTYRMKCKMLFQLCAMARFRFNNLPIDLQVILKIKISNYINTLLYKSNIKTLYIYQKK